MQLELNGKTAIITGGSGAIGRGLVLEFAREGLNVVSASRDFNTGMALARQAREMELPGTVLAVATDVTDRASVEAMLEQCHEAFGPVDVLVNNAGGPGVAGPLDQVDDSARKWELEVNVGGVVNCCQAVAADMLERGTGAIINISSDASLSGRVGENIAHYAGTKGFVNSLSKALAWEWARRGVRVNAVSPAWIVPATNTDLGDGSYWNKMGLALNGPPETMRQRFDTGELPHLDQLPIPRLGTPEDVAWMCLFLASEKAGYITGQLISVSGGAHMP